MSNPAFERLVTDSLSRIEKKVDDVGDQYFDLDKRVSLSDQRHGLYGAISGALTALAAIFGMHWHK